MGRIINLVFGITFVVIGILLLLATVGIISDFSYLNHFEFIWPIGLIIGGLLFIFKQRLIASIVLVLTIILVVMIWFTPLFDNSTSYDKITETQQIEYKSNMDEVYYELNFGAGNIKLMKGNSSDILVKNTIGAYYTNSTIMELIEGSNKVNIERNEDFFNEGARGFIEKLKYQDMDWNIELNNKTKIHLDLNYGAADVNIDLRGLYVDSLNIDNGASDNTIIFSKYPTFVTISTGASDFDLEFPKDTAVIVYVDGGMLDINLDGFEKIGDTYYSEGYKNYNETIKVEIDAGASSISGGFY